MDILWTPWRMRYILQGKVDGCVLCQKAAEDRDRENHVLYRGAHCYCLLNLYPYNPGHLMVTPYVHCESIAHLDQAILHELFDLVQRSVRVLEQTMAPNGFNIGINLGKPAGAGIADHVHVHIVPRWQGDTNFMPVLGQTKVMPEAMETTYDRLYPAFHAES